MKKRVVYAYYPFLFALFFSLSSFAFPHHDIHPDLQNAYQKILDLQLSEARAELTNNFNNSHDEAFKIYVLSLADFLELAIGRDPKRYNELAERESVYLEALSDLDQSDDFVHFIEGEIHLQWGLVMLSFEDNFSGSIRLFKAYRHTSKDKSEVPIDLLKTEAVLNILLGLLPEKYDWILAILNIRPDLNKGTQQLEKIASSESIFKLEASILYAIFLSSYQADFEAADQIYQKINNHNNLLINYLNSIHLIKSGNNDRARKSLGECIELSTATHFSIPFIDYFMAETYNRKLDYHEALLWYERFLNLNPDTYLKDASYKMYCIYILEGNRMKAEQYKSLGLSEGSLLSDRDRYAHDRLRNGFMPHRDLYPARLLFDGGYFQESINRLNRIMAESLVTTEEELAYHYRYARNYQKLNDIPMAMKYFRECTSIKNASNYYYWANAYIQMGHLVMKKDPEQAKEYFKMALSYSGKDYKNSITSEAKAALKLIE